MKVSICSITYNHERFIRQTLDGFLNQKFDGEIEIVVADDCSTDGTAAILHEYAERHFGMFRLILNKKNLGVTKNFKSAIEHCTGEFVALCEGDDYWIDELKLQKQIDLLVKHPEFAISFHRAKIEFFECQEFAFDDVNANTKTISNIRDLIKGNFIHTPTCVYRNFLFEDYPKDFLKFRFADWPLHLLNSLKGDIHFSEEEMSIYRVFSQGVWSTKSKTEKIIETIRFLNEASFHFPVHYYTDFKKSQRRYYKYLCKVLLRQRQFQKLAKSIIGFLNSYLK